MEASEKPTVLCLHGALGSAAQLKAALHPFLDHIDAYFFDFPGHGTQAPQPFTIEDCVHATRDFILQQNLAGATIFGYSMGGYVAMVLANRYPELVGQIITLGTKLDWNPHDVVAETAKLNPQKIEEKVPQYAEVLAKTHGDAWKEVLHHTAEMMKKLGDKPMLTEEVFERLMHPVLLCLATGDNMVTREETIRTAWTLPFGEFAEVPNSKHPIEQVSFDDLYRIVKGYF